MPRLLRRLLSTAFALLAALVLLGTGLVVTHRNAIVVTHGVSMNPVYYQGDLVVVQRQSAYRVGEIVAYRRPDIHLVVLHRIIGGSPSGWTFKGDNNQSIDPTKPTESQLIGRAVLHISRGGIWLHRLTSPPLLAAFAFLLLAGGGAASRRSRRKDSRPMPPRHRATPATSIGTLPPALSPVAAGAAAAGVAALALSGLAWTRPASHLVPAVSSTPSTMQFSYLAHVPWSPAYDGTTVTAPQPVFRKLTNAVDVTYAYRGQPGTLTVTAELSTPGGWKASLPLGGTRTIGRTYDGDARLDLRALQRRADAAAAATGLPAGEVSVAVIPQVSLGGGGTFASRFELTLDALTLKPTGDLKATANSRTTGRRNEPTRISVLGHAISTATARTVGLLTLLMTLVAAAVLAVIARMAGPVAEAERVRARYGELILPVLPVALAPGRPVVDVPEVASLARLAERYGLLVLHWSRGGVDTYVVQDEGTTFRYRTGTVSSEIPVTINT
jgi:signal peptidase I